MLLALSLSLLLGAGQAPYDWAWSRGQHATPAQWRAHERYEQRDVTHHGPTDTDTAATGQNVTPRAGTWLEDGTHDAHAAAPESVQAGTGSLRGLRPAVTWRKLVPLLVTLPRAPTIAPPVQPPRLPS